MGEWLGVLVKYGFLIVVIKEGCIEFKCDDILRFVVIFLMNVICGYFVCDFVINKSMKIDFVEEEDRKFWFVEE